MFTSGMAIDEILGSGKKKGKMPGDWVKMPVFRQNFRYKPI
jgi:hypothetical protein